MASNRTAAWRLRAESFIHGGHAACCHSVDASSARAFDRHLHTAEPFLAEGPLYMPHLICDTEGTPVKTTLCHSSLWRRSESSSSRLIVSPTLPGMAHRARCAALISYALAPLARPVCAFPPPSTPSLLPKVNHLLCCTERPSAVAQILSQYREISQCNMLAWGANSLMNHAALQIINKKNTENSRTTLGVGPPQGAPTPPRRGTAPRRGRTASIR